MYAMRMYTLSRLLLFACTARTVRKSEADDLFYDCDCTRCMLINPPYCLPGGSLHKLAYRPLISKDCRTLFAKSNNGRKFRTLVDLPAYLDAITRAVLHCPLPKG